MNDRQFPGSIPQRRTPPAQSDSPWMITFSDMLMLLLSFLVLRYALLSEQKLLAPQATNPTQVPSAHAAAPPPGPMARQYHSPKLSLLGAALCAPTSGRACGLRLDQDGLLSSETHDLTFRGRWIISAMARSARQSGLSLVVSVFRGRGEGAAVKETTEWQLKAVMRQFVDAGVPAEFVQIRLESLNSGESPYLVLSVQS